MSLRLIARDLYRLLQEVDRLQKELVDAPLPRRADLMRRIKAVKGERDSMKRILDGRLDR